MDKRYQLLEAKEKRVALIEQLLNEDGVVISLKTNYPSIEKDNLYTRKVVTSMNSKVVETFDVKKSYFMNDFEGYVYLYLIHSNDPFAVKRKTIEIENQDVYGRLVDLDVYNQNIRSISRMDLNEKKRKCFLCEDDAFSCIVTKKHQAEDLISYFERIVENNGSSNS